MAREFSKAFYNSKLWKETREYVLQRDRYMCQTQGCFSPAQEVHHKIKLTPENIDDMSIAVGGSNLISLCGNCHKRIHEQDKEEGRAKEEYFLERMCFDAEGYPIPCDNPPRG